MRLNRSNLARRGLGMVEATFATLIVSVVVVGALEIAGATKVTEYKVTLRNRANLLAQELAEEIGSKAYEESTAPMFGRESGEIARAGFDDVDDYHGWIETPPANHAGTPLSNMTGWSRSVKVEWVNPSNLNGSAAIAETGAKRITITVSFKNSAVVTWTVVKTNVS